MDRRTVIKALAASTGTSGISGLASARRRRGSARGNSDQSVAEIIREGNIEKAKKVADERNLKFEWERKSLPPNSDDGSGGVSGQDLLVNPEHGSGYADIIHNEGAYGGVWANVRWEFSMSSRWIDPDRGAPQDVAVIAWTDDDWELNSINDVYHSAQAYHRGGDIHSVDTHLRGGGLIGEDENAVSINIDDFLSSRVEKMTGSFQAKLLKDDRDSSSDTGRVEMVYKHMWSVGNVAGVPEFIASLIVDSENASVDVNVPVGADSWTARDDFRA